MDNGPTVTFMRLMRALATLSVTLLLGAGVAPSIAAQPVQRPFPDVIPLPLGWQPEGIAIGTGSTVYSGSLATGAIWKGDLRSGVGDILVPGGAGGVAVGLKYSRGLLYVAGGPTGLASVYDATSGALVDACQFGTPGATFVNDVIVTQDAAWFTDSSQPALYRIPIGPLGPACDGAKTLALSGEWVQGPGFNANGIAATGNGRTLIVMNTGQAAAYLVDPVSGAARRIASDVPLTDGDGILLSGRQLIVVQNLLNRLAVLQISPDLSTATLQTTLTDTDLDVPTTVAEFGNSLYVVNAKFPTPPTATTPYEIVKVQGR
jgi:sugar lactone lactonase YvrE